MRRRLLLVALVLQLGLAAASALFWARRAVEDPPGDFVGFYTAWTMVRDGQGRSLYDFEAQARQQREVMDGDQFPEGPILYLHPPHVALALSPLAQLSLGMAFWVWTCAQLGLLIWLLQIVGRGRPPLERWLVSAALVAAAPVLLTFVLGAFSLVVVVVVLQAHRALVAGRERAAGAWLALGTVKPHLVLTPAIAVLAGRRWRAVAVAAALTLLAVAAVAIAWGFPLWMDFARATLAVPRSFQRFGIHVSSMHNLGGALLFAFGPAVRPALPAIGLGGWLLAAATTVWIWRGPWRPAEPRFDLQLAATLLLGTFLGPYLYPQDGLMVVAAAFLCDSYLRRAAQPRTTFAVLALASPPLWFLTELAFPPPFVRFPVVLQLVLGAWIIRAWPRRVE